MKRSVSASTILTRAICYRTHTACNDFNLMMNRNRAGKKRYAISTFSSVYIILVRNTAYLCLPFYVMYVLIYMLFIKRWGRESARLIPRQPVKLQGGNADSDKRTIDEIFMSSLYREGFFIGGERYEKLFIYIRKHHGRTSG